MGASPTLSRVGGGWVSPAGAVVEGRTLASPTGPGEGGHTDLWADGTHLAAGGHRPWRGQCAWRPAPDQCTVSCFRCAQQWGQGFADGCGMCRKKGTWVPPSFPSRERRGCTQTAEAKVLFQPGSLLLPVIESVTCTGLQARGADAGRGSWECLWCIAVGGRQTAALGQDVGAAGPRQRPWGCA